MLWNVHYRCGHTGSLDLTALPPQDPRPNPQAVETPIVCPVCRRTRRDRDEHVSD